MFKRIFIFLGTCLLSAFFIVTGDAKSLAQLLHDSTKKGS